MNRLFRQTLTGKILRKKHRLIEKRKEQKKGVVYKKTIMFSSAQRGGQLRFLFNKFVEPVLESI